MSLDVLGLAMARDSSRTSDPPESPFHELAEGPGQRSVSKLQKPCRDPEHDMWASWGIPSYMCKPAHVSSGCPDSSTYQNQP